MTPTFQQSGGGILIQFVLPYHQSVKKKIKPYLSTFSTEFDTEANLTTYPHGFCFI